MARIYVTDRMGESLVVEGQTGASVMETLRELDNGVEALCGGMCSCATCHSYIDSAWRDRLPPRSPEEEELLSELEYFTESSRLTCQLRFSEELDGLTLTIAPEE
ncbi:MAG: 2Fe-2S iron-sulfur cluster-binding protein [Gammaproteobacteria bacterium]|nr:2Fe-2S iron-sulfur cluster-binding protein [Gammaproteobacteria bacterium]MDE0487855.1 2Fe-2S iron-sulfur cluster-binding protein [Gammaproteobacteria bacterium]MXZ28611.1 2Fe-2S iron-sulfur cluster binding domain-containing protein [Gammaproteobacteria bacterium]MYF59198.1 2Fe-2S iron-sulfur cluster binding domain-containing protein [Gammaproteobacteria bacterium]MYH34248.1 2Fe-2S iron-sulfur cluster binding domain-containing protein [Gammaproteobacteria bacterium]